MFKALVDQRRHGVRHRARLRRVRGGGRPHRQRAGLADKLFWATKLNVAGRGGGGADPAAARAQVETSFARIRKAKIDPIQVHNMGDVAAQIPILREFKQQGRVRYIGLTTTFEHQYAELVATMRKETLDFIGVDYADRQPPRRGDDPAAGAGAQDGRLRLRAVRPHPPLQARRRPAAARLGQGVRRPTWAQFFLKFVVSHPAVTVVTPATSQAKNMLDNIGGGIGRLPDEAMRKRMVDFVDALPSAP